MKKLLFFVFLFAIQAHSDSLRDRNRNKLRESFKKDKIEKEKKKKREDKKKDKKKNKQDEVKVDNAVLESQARWEALNGDTSASRSLVGSAFGAGTGSGSSSGFDPVLFKTMSKDDVLGAKPFEGSVDVNANGQWIACSQNGVYLSLGSPVFWQEVFTSTGAKPVGSNTIKIQCRISDSGSWVVINRSGIYKNSDADFYIADTVSSAVVNNNVFDLDMTPNGKWIASNNQGTWRFLNDGNQATPVLTSGNPGNGALSLKRIVKINSSGDWIIMTSAGVYKNGLQVLTNVSSTNIGGNIAYWSLDMNEQGDWAAISSRGTFLNATRISVVVPIPDCSSSPTIEANDIGEMIVKITDRNLSNEFTWMAISPKGIFRNAECIPGLDFLAGQTQYTLDMNNSGAWIAASENTALLNGTPITNDGLYIQTNNGIDNELLCKINDFSDYACLTNNGVFRNEDRGLTNAKVALASSQFTPTTFKHVLQLATNGAVNLLSENATFADRTGVYWGMNVQIPPPPQPTGATLVGSFLDWTDGGGSTAGYLVSVKTTAPTPTSTCSEGATLYVGTNSEFNIINFSDFAQGTTNYISLCAINSEGTESIPSHFNFVTQPFRILSFSRDSANKLVTLSWTSLPGKIYTAQRTNNLVNWSQIFEAPPSTELFSTAGINPAEFTMTRTFSDPDMLTSSGFYRIVSP